MRNTGLAFDPAAGVGLEGLDLLRRQRVALAIDQLQPVHPEGRLGEKPGIEFGRVDPGPPEQVTYPPPCHPDAECQRTPSIAASCAA